MLHPWCRRLVRWCELFFSSAKRRVKAGGGPHGRAPRATARTGGAVSNSKPGARPPADTADR